MYPTCCLTWDCYLVVLSPVRPETDLSVMFDPPEVFYFFRQIEVPELFSEGVFSALVQYDNISDS